jgi:hypothetical protein
MSQNRRVHPRYAISLSVEIYTGTDALPARAKNLSQGGVGVALDAPVPVGTKVGLSMFLVEDGIEDERTAPLNLQGEVVWCTAEQGSEYLAGVQFAQPGPDAIQRIQVFLRRLQGG